MQSLQRHPENHVFGLVNRSEDIETILQELGRRGIEEADVQIVRSQADAKASEPDEAKDGPLEGVVRAVERLSEEHEFNELYENKVEAGQCLVGIPISDSIDKETARDILREHGAHFINYYGQWVVEELDK